jgi:putative ABC transport system ATP-binding protein
MNEKTIIETIDLTKVYGMGDATVVALDGVSLQIKAGEFIAIMGPSGSGKSTLMHILGCLSQPSSGKYILDGQDVSDMSKKELALVRNKKLGFIFQAYNLLPRTDALRNVMMPILYDRDRKMNDEEGKAKAQRVAIARALINDPVMIIADEPTGNLDSKSGRDILKLLGDLHQQGVTIVMVTHDPNTAEYTQRVISLADGKIDTIKHNGHKPVVTALAIDG